MRHRLFARVKYIIALSTYIVVLNWTGISFASEDQLGPTRVKLDALEICLGPLGQDAVSGLRQGLLTGWGKGAGSWHAAGPVESENTHSITPPPAQYLDSLDMDLKACTSASQLKDDVQRQGLLDSVVRDINIKKEDCRRFGMGRIISVRVTTFKDKTPDNGWVVFYKWTCASTFPTEEVRFPQLTSPAIVELPPGEYTIRAEKRVSGMPITKLDSATVVVGSRSDIDIQFSIP